MKLQHTTRVIDLNGTELIVDKAMFVSFCKEFLDALEQGKDLFHPAVIDACEEDYFSCAVSKSQPFSHYEGLCYNFVMWVHFKHLGGEGSFVPSDSLYISVEGEDLTTIYCDTRDVLGPIFRSYVADNREGFTLSAVYPFDDAEVFDEMRATGAFYTADNPRLVFLRHMISQAA